MEYIMGIDLGTTGCKATVFDRAGQVRMQSYREYPTERYTGGIDSEMVWTGTCEVIRECTRVQPVIEAVCITSFGESVVLLDKNQKVLCESILYTSSQAADEWMELNRRLGPDKIYEITGHISHPMYTINRLMWYRKHCPDIYENMDQFLFFSGFAAVKLGGRGAAEDTQAARSMAYDVKNRCWSQEILNAAGVEAGKFPPVVSAGEVLGVVSEECAEALGLKNRPEIIAGGQDQPCVALGMGAVCGGDAVYGLGTVECLSVVLDEYCQSKEMKNAHLICAPHVVIGKYMTYGVLYSGGNVIREIRNRLYALERSTGTSEAVFDLMFREMEEEETMLTFIPHLFGAGTPQMKQNASGCISGLRAETGRGEILRAAIEGLSFDMRINVENMRLAGIAVSDIKAAGGGAKSGSAMQLRSDAMGEEFFIPEDIQAGTRGTFLIAAGALGWEIKNSLTGTLVKPQADKQAMYEKKYLEYRELNTASGGEMLLMRRET